MICHHYSLPYYSYFQYGLQWNFGKTTFNAVFGLVVLLWSSRSSKCGLWKKPPLNWDTAIVFTSQSHNRKYDNRRLPVQCRIHLSDPLKCECEKMFCSELFIYLLLVCQPPHCKIKQHQNTWRKLLVVLTHAGRASFCWQFFIIVLEKVTISSKKELRLFHKRQVFPR